MLDLAEQKQIPQSAQVTFQPIDKRKLWGLFLLTRRFGILYESRSTSYKYCSSVIVSKDFNNDSNYHGLYHYHQQHCCYQDVNMVPQEVHMYQHSNTSKE